MNIALISPRGAWAKEPSSASPYFMAQALRKCVGEVDVLVPGGILLTLIRLLSKAITVLDKQVFPLFGRQYYVHCIAVAWLYGKIYSQLLTRKKYDFIIAVMASNQIAFLKTDVPIVSASDATFAARLAYYPQLASLFRISVWEGHTIERRAIHNTTICMYNSRWAADSAIRDYHADPNGIVYNMTGPNIDHEFIPDITFVANKSLGGITRLLFIGADWSRKGGNIAYQTMVELNNIGCKATIAICGCDAPDEVRMDPKVRYFRYLNKGDPKESKAFYDLYRESDWLILPTRAECLAGVFLEAAAFGVPSLAPDTGGTKDAVIDGVTGFLMRYEDTGIEYAARISQCLRSRSYETLRIRAREFHDKHANWDMWAMRLKCRLKELGRTPNSNLNQMRTSVPSD